MARALLGFGGATLGFVGLLLGFGDACPALVSLLGFLATELTATAVLTLLCFDLAAVPFIAFSFVRGDFSSGCDAGILLCWEPTFTTLPRSVRCFLAGGPASCGAVEMAWRLPLALRGPLAGAPDAAGILPADDIPGRASRRT